MSGNFSQALPGDGTASRYAQPTFLCWDRLTACATFGESIMLHFTAKAEAVGFALAGIVGRPLYACTALKWHVYADTEVRAEQLRRCRRCLNFHRSGRMAMLGVPSKPRVRL